MAKRSRMTRSSSRASTGSTMSCINVGAGNLQSSPSAAESLSSTQPTSVAEDSTADATSTKQTSVVSTEPVAEDNESSTRRSARPRSVVSYNLGSLKNSKSSLLKETRTFSGDTLVNDTDDAAVDTPGRQQELLDEAARALNMEWKIDSLPGDPTMSKLTRRTSRRNSATLDKITSAAGKIKSALGKRGREAVDSGKEMLGLGHSKRHSGRTQELAKGKAKQVEDDEEDEAPAEPAAKKPKLLSQLSDISSGLSRSSSVAGKTMKRYQTAGLYVGQAADFDKKLKESRNKRKSKASIEESDSASLQTIPPRTHLPLPMFSALERERDFTIPFDVFAPIYRARGDERPKDWRNLVKNRFVGDAKELWRDMHRHQETSVCLCKPPAQGEEGCDENCLNRVMEYECDDSNCRLGASCTNRAFAELAERTKKGNEFDIGVEVLKTHNRGFGVRANRCFKPGQIILEYSGEVVTQEECERRMREEYKDKDCYYLMTFDQGMIIDATRGSSARFVNHSCDPNCIMKKMTVAGAPRMALFSGENGITTGEELTYDYNFDPFSTKNVQACHCGGPSCRGVLGPRPAGSRIPSSKKEKEGVAASLKRKAAQVFGSSQTSAGDNDEGSRERKVLKKRKTVKLPIGWAYVDDKIEQARLEEDRVEKGVDAVVPVATKLEGQRTGPSARTVSPFVVQEPRRSNSRMSLVKRVTSTKRAPEVKKEKTGSVLSRAASVLKSKITESTSSLTEARKEDEIKVLDKELTGSKAMRQSTLSFHPMDTIAVGVQEAPQDEDMDDKEVLLTPGRVKETKGLKRAASSAKDRLMGSVSRKGSSKAKGNGVARESMGTVRLVDPVE